MDHHYDQGWRRYAFDEIEMDRRAIHGSAIPIDVRNLFNRGTGRAHGSIAVVPKSGSGELSIGMHVHRDTPTGEDSEEWYIFVEGRGVLTFSNGDETEVGPGDLVTVYPGTGHSFRTISDEPVKMIALTPIMYTTDRAVTPYPEEFSPAIVVEDVNESMNPLRARCAVCDVVWERPPGDSAAAGLAPWAREHRHRDDCDGEGRPGTPGGGAEASADDGRR